MSAGLQIDATFDCERLPTKYVDHIQDAIWELRLKGKDGITRALYVTPAASVSSSYECS